MTGIPSLAHAEWLKAPPLKRLLAVIAGAGGEARVAGGAVRNALLGEKVADVDVATTLPPERTIEVCSAAGMSVHPTGLDHGTVTVVADHHPYEVTTLRHDVETDGRRAKVRFTDDWQADALRRDFTMNALYCDAEGRVFDFTGGYADILRRRVVFVGDASQRIREDYLRILRFFRFHARYGTGAPDPAGLEACVRHKSGLDSLSPERIRQEMFKLMAAPGAVATLQLMAGCGILPLVLPYTEEWDVIRLLPPDPVLRLAVLSRDPAGIKERWRLSNEEARRIEAATTLVPPSPALRPQERKIILYQIGAQAWRDAVQIARARAGAPEDDPAWHELLALPDVWTIPQFPVSGNDLIASGMAPGPGMGAALARLEDWWLASGFSAGKDELLSKL